MNTPYYTIITPCFNAGDKLNGTLDSVLSQTFPDYEIIVKDARSTDGSIEGMRRDRRINLIRARDEGIYDGMNQALATANGEYILFLNCGDVLHDAHVLEKAAGEIQRLLAEAESAARNRSGRSAEEDAPSADSGEAAQALNRQTRPAGAIFYGDVIERRTGQHVAANPRMTHLAMYRNLPCHQACFYSRDLFRERGFDTRYIVRADYEHFLWCVVRKGARAKALPLIVADYEGGGFSESEENRARSAAEHEEIAQIYFTDAEIRKFRLYMGVTLQPVREKLAQSPKTAALYDKVKNRIYGR